MRIDSAYYAIPGAAPTPGADALHGLGPAHPGDVERARQHPAERLAAALGMDGAQVAETNIARRRKHEPLRLFVRRVPFTAAHITRLKGSWRLATIHPKQLAMALDGQPTASTATASS